MTRRRTLLRITGIAAHLMTGTAVAVAIDVASRLGQAPSWTPRVVTWWHRRLLAILEIQVRVDGRLQPGCLLVSNHISWLDIPLIAAQGPVRFVAKSEVRTWPLIGWLAAVAETQFIRRGALDLDRITDGLAATRAAGQHLVIFPEGTTSDGTTVRPFHARLFALAAGLQVQPIALAFRRIHEARPDRIAPFLDDDTLAAHLLRLIRSDGLLAEVRVLAPLPVVAGETRRGLASRARNSIVDALRIEQATQPKRYGHGPGRRRNTHCPVQDQTEATHAA
jgi:1-acyl-sn-glycerol-3-phosphate acyltransferase